MGEMIIESILSPWFSFQRSKKKKKKAMKVNHNLVWSLLDVFVQMYTFICITDG